MRAARLYGREDLRVEDAKAPEIREGELLLKVKASAVCGTDVRMFRNGYRGVSPETPLILGHEIAGVVERTGAGVLGYAEGMRVAVAPNMGCGVCDQCVGGATQLCAAYRAFGINIDGGFAALLKVPEAAVRQGNLARIPEGVGFAEAALAEPLSCVYNAFQRSAIRPGDSVLVIGAGPIGLMHARLALMAGAGPVMLNDLSAERLQLCKAKEPRVVTLGSAGLPEAVRDATRGRGADVCITAAPSGEAQALAMELAALNGRIMFFGGLPEGKSRVSLDTNIVHYKQVTISGTARSSLSQFRATLALIASGALAVSDLITSTSPLDAIKDSFQQVMQGRGLKNVIEFA
jgi:L-iditol 2-dehydrogenase